MTVRYKKSPDRENPSVFNEVADLYDRVRPRYPERLFDDIVALTGIDIGARTLEIGAGTGVATLPLANRGLSITALEPGDRMSMVARTKLSNLNNVTFAVDTFEAWTLPEKPFDLVTSASALHWVEPSIRFHKSARALRNGGHVAFFLYKHVAGGDRDFFVQVQECYRKHFPGSDGNHRLPEEDGYEPDTSEIRQCGHFGEPVTRVYSWTEAYTTEQFIDLMRTYSDIIALERGARKKMLDCVRSLIDRGFGGKIEKRYLAELIVARKTGCPG